MKDLKMLSGLKIDYENIDIPETISNLLGKCIKRISQPKKLNFKNSGLYRVVDIVDEQTIKLDTGLFVRFLGVKVVKKEQAIEYLKNHILKKEV